MYTYRMTVSYEGTRYRGWQRQQNTDQTVQSLIERELGRILKCKVLIQGSGRTDSGVHAFAQEASMNLKKEIDTGRIRDELNQCLPEDIRILRLCRAENGFHARKSACAKCYEYYIDLQEKPDVFTRKYSFHFPNKVDLNAMQEAAEVLKGRYDFSSFTDLKDSDDTVRTIYRIEITKNDGRIKMAFYGEGFLYHMVRILTGTLLDVGIGKRKADQISAILAAKDRTWSGFPAPAKGLFLKRVYYSMEELRADLKMPEAEEITERVNIF